MNQKKIGMILIIVGIILGMFIYVIKLQEDKHIEQFISDQGTCYLTDGTCLHEDRDYTLYIIGGALSLVLIVFGVYLSFIDKTEETLARHQVIVSQALKEAKVQEKDKDEFKAFLSGFNDEEQKVILAIKEQDGIQQSTLRYRTGISKSSLSLMLKNFEERGLITRKADGKTNKVFLRKRF